MGWSEGMTASALISSPELYQLLSENPASVKLLDASYHLPMLPVRIVGAIDFDIDDVADPNASLAHTLPDAQTFAQKVGALGISNTDKVIIYDRSGMHMAASRAWWMFRTFGHEDVLVLNGGLPGWVDEGLPVQPRPDTPEQYTPVVYTPRFRPELLKTQENIYENLSKQAFTLLDARDTQRYNGDVQEPRAGVESGHVPGSLNLPFADVIDKNTGLLKSVEEIKQTFIARRIPLNKPLAVSCGSGVTAGIVALALHEIDQPDAAIYDGSWAEWGANPNLPKKTGDEP
jgi:thiosulfate/3-mercaptopyruvate sulfurtransferase